MSGLALLPLLALLTAPSFQLDPRDPNVCSLWESFTTSVKQSFSQPFDIVSEEPCSPPRPPHRCFRHRISYRTAYRLAVRTEHRRRFQCCPGFYESRDQCVARCTKECVHGRCVAPDRCQCEGGWRGEDCSSACDDAHWGPACGQPCGCENGAPCDPAGGRCRCPPGFRGRLCEDPCPPGSFGRGCLQSCRCGTGGACDPATGECFCKEGFTGTYCERPCRRKCAARCPCQNGGICRGKGVCDCPPGWTNGGICRGKGVCDCPPGWTGAVCTEACPEGRFGPNCTGECVCHNGGRCHAQTGACTCSRGYTGSRCQEECPAGTFGQDCAGVCDCANGARCFHVHGGCLCTAGFSGARCRARMCAAGRYGVHCQHTCPCTEGSTLSCHPMRGECTCRPGWAGLHCNETCPPGYYGDGCLEPCLCVNGGRCDAATGRCHCPPGFTGDHCESPCKSGTFGLNCSLDCSCENFIDCSPTDGSCFCKEGWRGPDCSLPCSKGTWGPGCNATCRCSNGAGCNPGDGSCTCTAGWQGALCDQPCPAGWFGPDCLKKCDCVNAAGCQPTTGECHCLPGWTGSGGQLGPRCNSSCFPRCPPGQNCLQGLCTPPLNASLEQAGSVMEPLPPGGESWGPVGGVLVVLLVLLLLVLLLLYRRSRRDKQSPAPPAPPPAVAFCARPAHANADVPHSYHHYYSNPSYHTLSQNRPPLPHLPNNHERIIKNTNNQLFCSVKNATRERRSLFGVESNATLPADWKHHEARKDAGAFGIDRSYSYSASLGKYYSKELKASACGGGDGGDGGVAGGDGDGGASSGSLSSENPYATIRDPPACPPESSYMEMKAAAPRDRAYTEIGPPPFHAAALRRERQGSLGHAPPEDPRSHYDLPVNSHIPGHYDLPPLRRPPPRRTPPPSRTPPQ